MSANKDPINTLPIQELQAILNSFIYCEFIRSEFFQMDDWIWAGSATSSVQS